MLHDRTLLSTQIIIFSFFSPSMTSKQKIFYDALEESLNSSNKMMKIRATSAVSTTFSWKWSWMKTKWKAASCLLSLHTQDTAHHGVFKLGLIPTIFHQICSCWPWRIWHIRITTNADSVLILQHINISRLLGEKMFCVMRE